MRLSNLTAVQFNSIQFNLTQMNCMLSKYEAICLAPWEAKKGKKAGSWQCLGKLKVNEGKSQTHRTQGKGKLMTFKERCLRGSEEEGITCNWPGAAPFHLLLFP